MKGAMTRITTRLRTRTGSRLNKNLLAACVLALGSSVTLGACTDDPRYLAPAESLEVGIPGTDIGTATTQIVLPIRLEEEREAMLRGEREAELGFMIPFVRRDDLDISLEWSIRNLDPDNQAVVRIHINGANEYFAYVPTRVRRRPRRRGRAAAAGG